ncbi:hypothetical protein Dimus_039587 [Dionaea muscipula]
MILPLSLSPNVTCPPSSGVILESNALSPVICLEHPLAMYHFPLVALDFKHTYTNQTLDFGTHFVLGPSRLTFSILLGTHICVTPSTLFFLNMHIKMGCPFFKQ